MSNEQSPLVSVIIPCYKQAHFLGEAIDSVFAQTYKNVEVIVVDDGSPDNTSEVANRYQRVRYIRQKNQGSNAARNTGIGASTGEYLVFFDADDRLLPEALEAGSECFDDHPESAFVCGHAAFISYDGNPHPYTQRPCINMNYASLLKSNEIVAPLLVMFRRGVFEQVGFFNVSLAGGEDYEMYLRITRRFPVRCHHKIIAEYRQHRSSASKNPELMLKSTLAVLHAQQEHVKGNKEYEAAYKCGVEFYREYYGEAMVNQLRERVRRRDDWRRVLHDVGVLARYYPRGVVENLIRKLRRSVTLRAER